MKILKTIKIIFSLIFVITFVPIVVGLIVGKKIANNYSDDDFDDEEDLKQESTPSKKQSKAASVQKPRSNSKAKAKSNKEITLTDRQSEIYKMIQKSKDTDIKPIEDAFKKVSARTLRRDLNILVESGKVKRTGSTKNTRYTI
jgi:predicted HTH transcriptional regulator